VGTAAAHRAKALDPIEVGVLDREDPRRREDLRTAVLERLR
jgi:hypothetical protein